jgi:ABC-type branched-subunit amino acid transport system substrate-binding protein
MSIRKAHQRNRKSLQKLFIRCGGFNLIVFIFCSFSLAAVLQKPFNTARADSTFLIGVSNAQSGLAETFGRDLLAGSRAYFDLVNAAGGVRGHKIRLLIKDDGYEPEPALSNTNELITKSNTKLQSNDE